MKKRNALRNEELIKDYRSKKYKLWELVAKYKIAHSTVYEILDTYGVKRNKKTKK